MISNAYDAFETGCAAYLNALLGKARAELVDAILDVTPKPAEVAWLLRVNQGRA